MGSSVLPIAAPCQTCYGRPCRRGSRLIAHARKQIKRSNKQQPQQSANRPEPTKPRILLEALEQELPQAPSPITGAPEQQVALSPGEIYPVFAPNPVSDGPWRWDDQREDGRGAHADDDTTTSGVSDVPRWNPRTGFMRTAAEVQAEAATAAAAAGMADTRTAASETATAATATSTASRAQASGVEVSLIVPPPPSSPPLPPPLHAVSRGAVLSSAVGTGFWMAVLAVFVRNYAALNGAAAMGTDPAAVEELLKWPLGLESLTEVGVAVGAAAAVTGARLALMAVWAELREATDRSNEQVLTPLGTWGILVVAAASGIPEELLFRGAVLPATFPDWRGLLLSAALFGVLHNSGGRNPAFAAWAAAVGALYGGAFLATGNVWVPAMAHAAANAASAFLWKAKKAAATSPPRQ